MLPQLAYAKPISNRLESKAVSNRFNLCRVNRVIVC